MVFKVYYTKSKVLVQNVYKHKCNPCYVGSKCSKFYNVISESDQISERGVKKLL